MCNRAIVCFLIALGLFCVDSKSFADISRGGAFEIILNEVLHGNTEGILVYAKQNLVQAGTEVKAARYRIRLPQQEGWLFFIDDKPLANWEHGCRYVFVGYQNGKIEIFESKMSPDDIERWDLLVNLKKKSAALNTSNPIGRIAYINQGVCENPENRYAVIISGGYDKPNNYMRYWNDCSAIYTTLKQAYGYTDDHIFVLIADGTDPGDDRRISAPPDYNYDSSPLDLDGDGDDDIDYAATKANMTTVFNTLRDTLSQTDSLFIYTTDHGGQDAGQDVHMYLWGEEITDDEFATEVDKVNCGDMMIVMEQCHSGGFIDDLSACGRTIATACQHDETSCGMDWLTYDEFVYHWTAAVRGQTPDGTAVDADSNDDGHVSMQEAFVYARDNDTCAEHPQYDSTPSRVGENLALCGIINSAEIHGGIGWLCKQQSANGSWQNNIAYTSMAALAFLNAGYTEDDDVVSNAIGYISPFQAGDGSWSDSTYNTSVAIWALKATGNPDYSDEIANAADYLKSIQSDDSDDNTHSWYGGWGYASNSKNNWSDLSNSQFATMALDAAGIAKTDQVWTRFQAFLGRVQNLDEVNDMAWANGRTDGGFTYSPHYNIWNNYNSYGSMTGAGIWGLRLSGVDVGKNRVQKALGWLENYYTNNDPDLTFNANPMMGNSYRYYYYLSFAKAMAMCFLSQDQAGVWYSGYFDKLKAKIASEQHADGYWNRCQGTYPDTLFALLALQTQQPPAADLWMSVSLASPADLVVYDPQDRICSKDTCTIPGAKFEIDAQGHQLVTLPELEAGHYRFVLLGTGDGECHLTVKGYRGDPDDPGGSTETSSVEKVVDIKKHEVLKSDVLISSMVGALTIHVEDPEPPVDPGTGDPLPYDFDGDGDVDIVDIMKVASKWDKSDGDSGFDDFFDFDNDGYIGIFDIMPVAGSWTG